ncbi:MAG TPA: M14 family zinc carboxypeptidase, partial [Pilimelia sp.]|nr:M14 family zinc carboxypeptidase [Pilimelia sp.]
MRFRVPRSTRRPTVLAVTLALAAFTVAGTPVAAAPDHGSQTVSSNQYRVLGPRTFADRNAVAGTGAAIDYSEHGRLYVTATPAEVKKIRSLGFTVEVVQSPLQQAAAANTYDFPPADSGYHNYAELTTKVNQVVAAYPSIARKFSIGRSHEGRDIFGVKISDNVATDENEPEILFNAQQHAREHLTTEMAVYLMDQFTRGYGSDSRITNL